MSKRFTGGEVRLRAPAKINFILEVIDRRPDGYHEIDSIFVPVDLCDEVTVNARDDSAEVRICCDDPAVPIDQTNTAWRAVEAFANAYGPLPGIDIGIVKRIPAGAGLGGGSSDAAAVLRALARLAGVADPAPELFRMAAGVGADVPFFLRCVPARVRGIGEIVEPIPAPGFEWVAIAWPRVPVSTRSAYAELDLSLTWPKTADRIPRFLSGTGRLEEAHNDFEAVVGRNVPQIPELKGKFLALGAITAGLSGSGSAVFGTYRDANSAARAAAILRGEGAWSAAAKRLQGVPE